MPFGKWAINYFKTTLVGITLSTVLAVLGIFWVGTNVPTFENVKSSYKPSDKWVVDRNDFPLEMIRTKSKERSLSWVELPSVSHSFLKILLVAEDKRFYTHSGVDFIAIGHSFFDFFRIGKLRGASTLSMQLGGLLKQRLTTHRRNPFQKILQIFYALKLETQWSKEEILEAYVNLNPFRGELVGLRAASLGYFSKNPEGLVDNEAALLVALIRSPNASPEAVAKRACFLLPPQSCESVLQLAQSILSRPYDLNRERHLIPVFSQLFARGSEDKGLIKTSLDYDLQSKVLNLLREQLSNLKNQNVKDAAAVVLNTKTGEVLAYAANGGNGFTTAGQIDGVQAKRQAGSTIKPFVYATAFDLNILDLESLVDDSPADFSLSDGRVYHPKNYDYQFRGRVSAAEALASSLNVPAVRTIELVGEQKVLENLGKLGFTDLESSEFYGPSLALGSVDISLWQLTNAYRHLANDSDVFKGTTRKKIFDILSLPEYRRFTFGLDSILGLPFPAAVKTGTSKDMRDNWCIGWTTDFTVGVWVGNFSGEPMWNVSGISGAAPIWRQIMLQLHPNFKKEPAHFINASIALTEHTHSKIRYPADEMIVAVDPDIPVKYQKMPIEIDFPQKGHRIFMNDRLLDLSKEMVLWPIKKGRFVVRIKDQSDDIIDQVSFSVR